MPREYYAAADPFVALGMAAAATTTLKLATGICLLPQRDVIQTAKQVASLDALSGGRFLFGIGAGWNKPETEDHGTVFAERFGVMRERVEAMKELWTQEKGEYHGKYVDFGPSYAWPKPAQKPHPPIHVGGAGLPAVRRAVRYGDGWVPLYGKGDPLEFMEPLREQLKEAGRDPENFEISFYFCPPERDVIERSKEAGAHRLLFPMPSVSESEALGLLDNHAALLS